MAHYPSQWGKREKAVLEPKPEEAEVVDEAEEEVPEEEVPEEAVPEEEASDEEE